MYMQNRPLRFQCLSKETPLINYIGFVKKIHNYDNMKQIYVYFEENSV